MKQKGGAGAQEECGDGGRWWCKGPGDGGEEAGGEPTRRYFFWKCIMKPNTVDASLNI